MVRWLNRTIPMEIFALFQIHRNNNFGLDFKHIPILQA